MYEEFYGFKEKPFQIVPNLDYLYLSNKHKNALTCLEYGLNDNVGFILLTGEIGSGKPVGEMAEGNGFLHRLEKLEEKIQQIQLQVDWQNAEIDRKINGPTKDLVARLKAHLQNERKRSAHLADENASLRKKLRELEHLKARF